MALSIDYYSGNNIEWDNFILNKSMNGTFLQTRKFIDYHKDGKFKDCSICIRKGDELVAAILACGTEDDGKAFFAHKGTTFGGITISKQIYNASQIDELMNLLESFLLKEGFKKAYFKMVPQIYQKENADLIDYFLYKYGYTEYSELNYYMHLDRYKEDVISQFTTSKRRDFRYSLKNNLEFKVLNTKEEIEEYYGVLLLNLKKLGLNPVHTYDDLIDLKFNRFDDIINFYGVYLEDKMIAGSMTFDICDDIVHTQYLSSDEQYLKMFPMDFLIENLIQVAVDKGKKLFSFGICTEDQGRYLNLGLSRFKEGFGTEFCINKSFEKVYK